MQENVGARLVARAVTVRFVPARADAMAEKPSGEDSPEYAAFERAGPGDVIVMEAMRNKVPPPRNLCSRQPDLSYSTINGPNLTPSLADS
eukprot:COSAG02_NODE_13436_length_1395_cov_4.174383_3_plen_90_part_00